MLWAFLGSRLWLVGVVLALAAGLWLHGCAVGKKGEHDKLVALEQGYKVAAAATEARNRERLRAQSERVKDVEVRYEKIVVQPNRERARTERERLRDAAARGSRVPITAEPAGCPAQTGGATRAELLGYGEAIIGLAEQAARDHAGLEACLAAWPR